MMENLPSISHTFDAGPLGYIQGLSILSATPTSSQSKATSNGTDPVCHFFGGIPYALPPVGSSRWRKPRPLAPCYQYGTRSFPADCTASAGVCTQLNAPSSNKQKKEQPAVVGEENSLQLNIWIPAGEAPKEGWPVVFYIHGGFLQFGSPNSINPVALLAETEMKCMFVAPAYRLNVFGFLASSKLSASSSSVECNFGFWDQRLALEWTWKHCALFGGNASNVTIAGFSAGAHSVFHQLAHDLWVPENKRIVKQAIMWSNSPGVQPKSMEEAEVQFNELLGQLEMSPSLPREELVKRLQALQPDVLARAIRGMKYHQFRATTDDSFVRKDLFKDIGSGEFAARMKSRGIKLMIGDCKDEHWAYANYIPPSRNGVTALATRLEADFPCAVVARLVKHYFPGGQLPSIDKTWKHAFGRLYADLNIHMLQRGFLGKLAQHGAGDLIYRYRIEWRSKSVGDSVPISWGVTHGTDQAIWWWGNGRSLPEDEKSIVKANFIDKLHLFVKSSQDIGWGTTDIRQVSSMQADGKLDFANDDLWESGLQVWKVALEDGATEKEPKAKL